MLRQFFCAYCKSTVATCRNRYVKQACAKTILSSCTDTGVPGVVGLRPMSAYPGNIFEEFGLLKPGYFSLQVGAPNPIYLKAVSGYLETAFNHLGVVEDFHDILQYGTVAGMMPVREEVAKFLTRHYGQDVCWEDVFITSGATSGLGVLIQHFFDPSQIMFAENPTYPIFAKFVNKDKQITGVPIPMESDGLDVKYFEKQLKNLPKIELSERRPFRAAVYLIPTYHNPTGICYSPEKCRRIVQLAREHDLLVICDDVYNTLSYQIDPEDGQRFLPAPPRLFSYDDKNDPDYKGHVISNGSFAKIIAPGLRMGWYETPQRVRDLFNDTYLGESGGGQSAYISRVVAEALRNGSIDKHVHDLRLAHKERMAVVISKVEEKLSSYGVTISHPTGGYFLWIKLPQGVDSSRVLEISLSEEKVTFVKGNIASLDGDFANYIRISIAYYESSELDEGIERLCRSIEAAIMEKS